MRHDPVTTVSERGPHLARILQRSNVRRSRLTLDKAQTKTRADDLPMLAMPLSKREEKLSIRIADYLSGIMAPRIQSTT
jgi:hypothetical protein